MKFGRKTAAIVLLFVALVLVNFLASRIPGRVDATADKIYTLSNGTKALLGKIEEPITLEFYYTRNVKGLPVAMTNFAERVQEMLQQYVRSSRGKLTLTIINPQPDTPEEEKASVAGIDPERLDSGDNFIFGMSAIQADQQKSIAAFNVEREQYLEYDISQLIYSVQQVVKKKLGLITSMPLLPKNDIQSRLSARSQADLAGQLVSEEWGRTFTIVPIEPTATSIPADIDVLAIVHPQALHPKLQFAIDQFLLGGKPIFLAVDPSSWFFHRQTTQLQVIQGGSNNGNSDMPTLLSGWGIQYDLEKVAGDANRLTTIRASASTTARSPFVLSLRNEDLNSQAMPTSSLSSIMLPEAGSVSLAPGTNLTFTPLLQTTDAGGEVDADLFTDQSSNIDAISNSLKPTGRKTLAAIVAGKFKTAFPGGMPPDPTLPDGSPAPIPPGAAPVPTGPALTESKVSSNLIVVADADFLMNDYSVRQDGLGSYVSINDNMSFAVNAVEYLGGSQDLIAVRGKRSAIRPFTVVRDMETEAEKKFGEQMAQLQAKQKEVQSKLSDLRQQADESRQLVPSPELTTAIDDYRKQNAAVNSQIREIRRNLRTDIDALKTKLLAINLLSTPILVVLFGMWFYRRRQRA